MKNYILKLSKKQTTFTIILNNNFQTAYPNWATDPYATFIANPILETIYTSEFHPDVSVIAGINHPLEFAIHSSINGVAGTGYLNTVNGPGISNDAADDLLTSARKVITADIAGTYVILINGDSGWNGDIDRTASDEDFALLLNDVSVVGPRGFRYGTPGNISLTITLAVGDVLDFRTRNLQPGGWGGYVSVKKQFDTDGDGLIDCLDTDSDNDGIPDALEANHSLTPAQIDDDGRLEGNVNAADGVPDIANGGFTPVDTDNDNKPDYIDIDSDNDGIVDVIESQSTEDYKAPTGLDHDNDGIDNAFDVDFHPDNSLTTSLWNTDGTDLPDIYDLDSDNDGRTDEAEANQGTYVAADADGDGLADVFENDTQTAGTNSSNWGQTADNPFPIITGGPEPNWRSVQVWFDCGEARWEDGAGNPVTLNNTSFTNATLIVEGCCTAIIDVNTKVAGVYLNDACDELVVENCLRVDGFVTNNGEPMKFVATSDTEYGQYFGPPTELEFEMIMEEDGWHTLALPVASVTAQELADANNTTAEPLLINVDGLTSFIGDANIELYNSAISGGKEMGFVRTDGAYSTHSYGTWTPADASTQLAKKGFNYYINPYFTNGERKIRVVGTSLEENVVTSTSDNFGGWNLIPNPYPVTVSVLEMYNQGFFHQGNDVSNPLVFDAAIWIWDGSESFTPDPPFVQSSGSYVLHDAISGIPIQNGSDLTPSPGLVAPFQSFWVRRTSAYTARRVNEDGADLQAVAVSVPTSATVDPAPLDKITNAQLIGVGGPLTGPADAEMKPTFRTDCSIVKHYKTQSQYDVVKLRVSHGNHSNLFDETLLTFGSQFTEGYDLGYDISRNSAKSGAPFLVSEVSGKGLVINRMPYPVTTTQVPLFFTAENDNAPYVLEINETSGGYTVYVEDLKTGKWHLISESSYTFENDVKFKGHRFILHFKMGAIDISEFQPNIRAWRAKEGVKVQLNNLIDAKARIRIADATGRTIHSASDVDTQSAYIYPAHNLAAGVYTITVITESGNWIVKVAL